MVEAVGLPFTFDLGHALSLGPEAINILKQADTGIRVVTVGGDQLTGKSTLSKILASKLHATYLSAGTVFRMTAKEKGVSVGELSRLAQSDKDIDGTLSLCCDAFRVVHATFSILPLSSMSPHFFSFSLLSPFIRSRNVLFYFLFFSSPYRICNLQGNYGRC